MDYWAALSSDTIEGVDNAPPHNIDPGATSACSVAVVSQAAMDGGNGGWAILYGSGPSGFIVPHKLALVTPMPAIRPAWRDDWKVGGKPPELTSTPVFW